MNQSTVFQKTVQQNRLEKQTEELLKDIYSSPVKYSFRGKNILNVHKYN